MDFEKLYNINVNDKIEEKAGLKYLSWSYAVAEITKQCQEWKYEIKMFDEKPYMYDEDLGYMVFTSVNINNITKDMWLPVMDSNNKAMKNQVYEYNTKFGKKNVEKATMFDINKTIMRCLVKNIAMFGLGLYIYAGEDLPEEDNNDNLKQKVLNTFKNSEIIPTEEDIKKYILEKQHMNINSLSIFNYCQSKNWKDKNGNMINYKTICDYFEKNNNSNNNKK